MDLNTKLGLLFDRQIIAWPLAKNNYAALKKVEEREIVFDNCSIRLQFNPARILSTGAKISPSEIRKRACFLCAANRPSDQESLDYMNKYNLLVNPFPIMPRHFTIAHKEHVLQSADFFPDMLSLAQDLYDYSIVYNGGECGASAPDHHHFQAGSKDFIQTELELDNIIKSSDILLNKDSLIEYEACDYLRKTIIIKSDDRDAIIGEFRNLLATRVDFSTIYKDAKLNIITRFDKGVWSVIIFLRKAHRPSHYTREDSIIISPGVIDMGGVLICPRKEDFLRITKNDIIEIFEEVSL
jgi:hypothetical protein